MLVYRALLYYLSSINIVKRCAIGGAYYLKYKIIDVNAVASKHRIKLRLLQHQVASQSPVSRRHPEVHALRDFSTLLHRCCVLESRSEKVV